MHHMRADIDDCDINDKRFCMQAQFIQNSLIHHVDTNINDTSINDKSF